MDAAIEKLDDIARQAKICSNRSSHQTRENNSGQTARITKKLLEFYKNDFGKGGGDGTPATCKMAQRMMKVVVRCVEEAKQTIRAEQSRKAAKLQGISAEALTQELTKNVTAKEAKKKKRSAPGGSARKKQKISGNCKPLWPQVVAKKLHMVEKSQDAERLKTTTVMRAECESLRKADEEDQSGSSDEDEKMHMQTEVGPQFLLSQAANKENSEGSDSAGSDAKSEISEDAAKSRSSSTKLPPEEEEDPPKSLTMPEIDEVLKLEEIETETEGRAPSSETLRAESEDDVIYLGHKWRPIVIEAD